MTSLPTPSDPAWRAERPLDGGSAPVSFGQLWRDTWSLRRSPEAASAWDKRIATKPTHYGPGAYSEGFLKLADIRAGERVFDMGCGAGSLAIPLAAAGNPVTAADFSQGMLDQLALNAQEHGVFLSGSPAPGCVTTLKLAWDDDWDAAGIHEDSFDVALASRSIITPDLEDAIRRLSHVASRKVCVTAIPGSTPRCFAALLRDLGLTPSGHPDAAFVFAVATELGYEPSVSYLHSGRADYFRTKEDAFAEYEPMLAMSREDPQGSDRDEYLERLDTWLDEHLMTTERGGQTVLTPDIPRTNPWAFISWDT